MMIVQDLLLELWSSPANVAAAQRVCLADALLRCFEGNATSDWSVHHNAFWTLLGTQLAVVKTDRTHRDAAFGWLVQAITAPERAEMRSEIVRTIEDSVLNLLDHVPEDQIDAPDTGVFVRRMLVPLLHSPVLSDLDSTLRRLLGFVFRLPDAGRASTLYSVHVEAGQEADMEVSEQEEEEAILQILRDAANSRGQAAVELYMATVRVKLERGVPGIDGRAIIDIGVPVIHLLLSDVHEMGPLLFDYMVPKLLFSGPAVGLPCPYAPPGSSLRRPA